MATVLPDGTVAERVTVADATVDLWAALGPIATMGVGDAQLGYPLLRFLDGIGQLLQRLNDLALADAVGNPGWSRILDIDRCPTYALPWLAQCVGVRFDQTTNTDATQRSAIQAEQGFRRGSPTALQAAAAKWLQPGQSVVIYERTPDPYSFTVVIGLGQLTQGTFSQTQAAYPTFAERTAARSTFSTPAYPEDQVRAALEAQKPAGLLMNIEIVDGPTFEETDTAFATFADREAALPTFADVVAYTP